MPIFSKTKAPKMNRPSNNPEPAPTRVAVQTVYFAYGSNLQLAQMAQRCPESRYLGCGRLPDFKWQINTRGVANIYPSVGDTVEGLCFLLSQKDEARLDANEGVPSAYEKQKLPVQIYAATASIVGRRVREVMEVISASSEADVAPKYYLDAFETVEALVYINWERISDGVPRTEYVARINAGTSDAQRLGIHARYFEKYVRGPMQRVARENLEYSGRSNPGQQKPIPLPTQAAEPDRRTARLQNARDDSRDWTELEDSAQE